VRLDARKHVTAIVPLLTSPDSALAHLAVQSLVALGARDVALHALTDAGSSPDLRTRARFVLQQMHDGTTVAALLAATERAQDPAVRRELVATLARLYSTEGPWKGEWWGTHPSTMGPYFTPVTWAESARILPALRQALVASGGDASQLVDLYVANRVLPAGSRALLLAAGPADPQRDALLGALLGTSRIAPAAVPVIAQLDAKGGALHDAVVELLAGETTFDAATLPLARAAVFDTTVAAASRAKLLAALAQMPGDEGRNEATAIFARLTPRAGAPASNDPVDAAWRRFVGERLRFGQLDYFLDVARSADPAQRTLAYAVLLQAVRSQRTPAEVREKVTPVLDAAWADPALTPRLVDAIQIMRLESPDGPQLQAYRAKTPTAGGN
jgi:hypothetical protein